MFTTTVIAAAAEGPDRGWGGPVALLVALTAFGIGAGLHYHFVGQYEDEEAPSPARRGARGVRVKPQVNAGVDTDDTARDTEPDTGWWGRIANVGGRRVRVYDQPAEPVDEEVDVALDEEETVEDVIDRLDFRGVPYGEIVATIMGEFHVSEATAKRRIRDARAARAEVS